MNKSTSRLCPVCGSGERRLIYRQRFWDGPMGDGYDVVVCTDCGAGYADKIPSQAEMDRYYAEQSKYTNDQSDGTESPWDLKRFEATAGQIIPHLKKHDTRILDIGCATGGLLSVLKKRGFANLLGVDPSPVCAALAGRLHDVEVKVATLAQLSNWKERFDLIMMVGVLEHLHNVKEAISILSGLLNPGGILYCAVPDVEGLAACPNAPYQQFSIEHVNFFSSTSLRRVMAECCMTEIQRWKWVVEWREDVNEPILSALYKYSGNRAERIFDVITGPALDRYLASSSAGDRTILMKIASLVSKKESILVWGAGTLTRRLLASTRFSEANIVAFVDSNTCYQGRTLAGRPILSPRQIMDRNEPILVCSVSFSKEIILSIRNQYRILNRIITL
jgi:SAM-dependent methyltransferase